MNETFLVVLTKELRLDCFRGSLHRLTRIDRQTCCSVKEVLFATRKQRKEKINTE